MAQNEQSSRALSSSLYTYQPLPDEHTIRILILNPGEDDDPLSGFLGTARLIGRRQASTTPQAMWSADRPYEAVSYVWGSNTMGHLIHLDGKVHKITANLNDALHQCRLSDRPRALWADSICIDQADLKEKGHQVALMSRIYSCSQRTLICLGSNPEHRHDAQKVFSILLEANEMIERTFRDAKFSWEAESFPWPDPGDPLVTDSRWQFVAVMTKLDWFERGWVIQEVALGREAFILWAGFDMLWSVLTRVSAWYAHRVRQIADKPNSVIWSLPMLFDQTYFHQRRLEAQTFRLDGIGDRNPGILSVLDAARKCTLSDPRDRIYAFAALPFLQRPVPALEPDYEQSHLDVYQAFAVKYLNLTKNLNILLCAQSDISQGSSWIPRWDREGPDTNQFYLDSTKGFGDSDTDLCKFNITEGNSGTSPGLQIRAVIFDSIIFASMRLEKDMTVEGLAAVWRHMKELSSAASGQDEFNAMSNCREFVEAFSGGFWYGSSVEQWDTLLDKYAWFLDEYTNDVQESDIVGRLEKTTGVTFAHEKMLSGSTNSKIFLLGRGYFGFGSWVVEEGDICAFVFGVDGPLILRSFPDGMAHHFKIVGSAWVVSKGLDEEGRPMGFEALDEWYDWNELCESQRLTPLSLKVEEIILY